MEEVTQAVQATQEQAKPKAKRTRLTQERKDLIIKLRKSGKSQHYIREHTGHSLGTIVKILKEAKLAKGRKVTKPKSKPIVTAPANVIYEPPKHILPVKTNFLQRFAISLCRSLGVTDRMYGEN